MDTHLRDKLLACLLPYQPQRVGVFGSFARDEQTKGSDIDVLIRFKNRISLLKLVQIEQEISDKLGVKIDLVTENSLKNKKLIESIQKDIIIIYE